MPRAVLAGDADRKSYVARGGFASSEVSIQVALERCKVERPRHHPQNVDDTTENAR